MSSSDLDLYSIGFQTAVRSSPVRENFTNIQSEHNLLRAEVLALATPPAGTEVTLSRDFHTSLVNRLRSAQQLIPKYMITGGAITAQGTPDMTVHAAAGEASVAGVACIWDAQDSGTITPHATLARWDTVVVNTDNSLSIVAGTAAASPVLPTLAATQKKLAHLYIAAASTEIETADIRDARRESLSDLTYLGLAEPVGTIKHWHKTLAGTPALTAEWQEMDGTACADPESVYYGVTIPDWNGENRYLKGADTSGTEQASTNKAHAHGITTSGTSADHTHSGTTGGMSENDPHNHGIPSDEVQPASSSTYGNGGGAVINSTANTSIAHTHTFTTGNQSAGHNHSISEDSTGATDVQVKNATAVLIIKIK